MKREISSLGLLFTSVSSILGSGWLFSTFYASKVAGPASLIAWILGGILICIVAFVFGEVCALIPISGSSVRIPNFTHGKVVSIFFALIIWLSYVGLMVIELQAVIQYLSYYFPSVAKLSGDLTLSVYILAIVLMFLISVINTYSVKFMIKCNTFLTFIKLIIPLGIAIVLLYYFFSPHNLIHPGNSPFAPDGIHGIFLAIATGGIIFSFNAFKQAAELAGEVKNPQFSVPFAIVGSIVLCVGIFILLQAGFLSTLGIQNIKDGWQHLHLSDNNSPFASVMQQHKILWLIPILYIAAIISPLGAALMYCTGGARSLFGLAVNGCAPKALTKTNNKSIPTLSIWINLIIGMIIFLFFKGWDTMAALLTCLFAISYSIAPICMIALRFQLPEKKRPLKLPFGLLWAYIAFFVCTLFIYWTGWHTIHKLIWFLLTCLIIIIIYHIIVKLRKEETTLDWKSSLWLWPYFIGIIIFSFIGNYGGGRKLLGEIPIMILIAVFCLIIVILAGNFKLSSERTKKFLEEIE